MTETTVTTDKVALQERREQLAARLSELQEQAADLLADVAAAEQDFLDCIETGSADPHLLSERVEHRKRELATNRRAADHLAGILADLDRQISEIEQNQQLDRELADYREQLAAYRGRLDDLRPAPLAASRAIQAAVRALQSVVTDAREHHERLTANAAALRAEAAKLGRETTVPDPQIWHAGLEPTEHGGAAWVLYLALIQNRSAEDLFAALWRMATVSP